MNKRIKKKHRLKYWLRSPKEEKQIFREFLQWCDEHVSVIGSNHYVYVGYCTITKEQEKGARE